MTKLPRIAWSVITFGLGAFGFISQAVSHGSEKPFLLAACLVLMGFPVAQYLDAVRRRD